MGHPLALTNEGFIERAIRKHGDRYDYSLVNYVKSEIKIVIICKVHGQFLQRPNSHLGGSGCSHCWNAKEDKKERSNTQDFIEKATLKHGDRYDYSLVNYVKSGIKVVIICKAHGEFLQTPGDHFSAKPHGCPDCGIITAHNKKRFTAEEFIARASEKHGNWYDYSLVEYFNSTTSIKIICPTHGEFEQTPQGHLTGRGCYFCGKIRSGDAKKLDTQGFIALAGKKHHDIYDYSLVNFVKSVTPVEIICPTHGVFSQTPNGHLTGSGCHDCATGRNSGKTHYKWNPSFTEEERKQGRNFYGQALISWRKSVFGRDNFTCRRCNESSYVQAHHILPWSKFPEVRFDIDNGITFCKPCHKKYHSRYKLAECNHKTIAEFLAANASTITIDLLSSADDPTFD